MLTARRIWLTQNQNRNESNKRQKRSQSQTPKKINKISINGNNDKLRRSMTNLSSAPIDDTDGTVSTKKSVNCGPKKDN